ncbi:MAG: IS3 family transposase, partial [Candidatus Helarchaeales archaeon]
ACDVLEISERTYFRWERKEQKDQRKGSDKQIPRKLTQGEEDEVVRLCCSMKYKDLNPYLVYISLLESGQYLASIRTIYRILKKRDLLHHRGKSRPRKTNAKPDELVAEAPNQVFSWDITYLKTLVRGVYFYAYMVIDIWSREIVGWEIHNEESEDLAQKMFSRISVERNLNGVKLHSDNGSPMKGATMLMTLYSLGVVPSFSRPRVSDDNPFSEALFKTIKYMPAYPGKFKTIDDARKWMADFVHWYNTKHKHSGIGYITPEQRASGKEHEILKLRNDVIQKAFENNPQRWSSAPKKWNIKPTVTLNKKGKNKEKIAA